MSSNDLNEKTVTTNKAAVSQRSLWEFAASVEIVTLTVYSNRNGFPLDADKRKRSDMSEHTNVVSVDIQKVTYCEQREERERNSPNRNLYPVN